MCQSKSLLYTSIVIHGKDMLSIITTLKQELHTGTKHIIGFTIYIYTLLNGFLLNIMSELCMVNNEVHDHFTRQFHSLCTY